MWCAHKSVPVLASFSLACKGKLRSRSAIAYLSELCSVAGLLVLHCPHPQHIVLRESIQLWQLCLWNFSCWGNSWVNKYVVSWHQQSCIGSVHHHKYLGNNSLKNIYMYFKMKNVRGLEKRTLLQVFLKVLTAHSPNTLFSSLFAN